MVSFGYWASLGRTKSEMRKSGRKNTAEIGRGPRCPEHVLQMTTG